MTETTILVAGGAWLLGIVSTSVLVFLVQRHGMAEARLLGELLARQEERQRCLGWMRQMAWTPMPIEVQTRYHAAIDGIHLGGPPPAAA